MRIVVTGGAGFIGSALTRLLMRDDRNEVIVIDKLTYAGTLGSLEAVFGHDRFQFHQVDVCDGNKVNALLGAFAPDAIVHLAAESHVDRSINKASDFLNTNCIGTFTMLQAALRCWHNRPPKRRSVFIHVSTDEVFGSLGNEGAFTEESRYDPRSPYSASKAASDHFARAWYHTYNLPVIVTNCSNNYGPYQFPEKLIPVTVLACLEQRTIPVYGTGQNVRDWLHVEDHVSALNVILERGVVGESYNIGGNSEYRNLDVVTRICDTMDELRPPTHLSTHRELIHFVSDRLGHDFRYAIDSTKLCTKLGWSPSHKFEAGLESTIKWYLENKEWWEPLRPSGHLVGEAGPCRS